VVTLTTALAATAVELDVRNYGDHEAVFIASAGAATGDCVIDVTGATATDSFSLDNLVIEPVNCAISGLRTRYSYTEVLPEPNFTSQTYWVKGSDWSYPSSNAKYLHGSGSSELYVLAANLLVELAPDTEYTFSGTFSSVTAVGTILLKVTESVATADTSVGTVANGAFSVTFTTNSNPGAFKLRGVSNTASDTFIIDSVSLKVNGDVPATIFGGPMLLVPVA